MCDECIEIDKTIARYRSILLSLADVLTIERIEALIKELKVRKISLHSYPQDPKGD